jgi:hypothetical protein
METKEVEMNELPLQPAPYKVSHHYHPVSRNYPLALAFFVVGLVLGYFLGMAIPIFR